MHTVEVTLALPPKVFQSVEKSATGAGMAVGAYLADVVGVHVRTEEDAIAIEGYQSLAKETLEFTASAMATVRETWPRWEKEPRLRSERGATFRPPAKNTCRAEVLAAASAVMRRNGTERFTMHDVINELHQRGSKYAVTTIRTHISSRMCANAKKNHGSVSDDLERLDHGLYRLTPSAIGRGGANGE